MRVCPGSVSQRKNCTFIPDKLRRSHRAKKHSNTTLIHSEAALVRLLWCRHLLDVDQEGCGVIESDYGKAIAVHVGGDRLSDGTIVNFAFKIS
eukprot:scaffold4305_cov57-Cylindrotheca_fusiformis.AAC.1